MHRGRFRSLRIFVLLVVLVGVAGKTGWDRYRTTRWQHPLVVAIYPIAADASPVTARYVDSLDAARFTAIDRFFAREAARYHVAAQPPIETRLRPALAEVPPQRSPDAGVPGTVLWSLRLRYFAWRVALRRHETADIQMFVLYRDPRLTPTVPHSLGLEKGLVGVVYAFAAPAMSGSNDVIIAHELLHTLGATDKYDPADDAPRFPDGYGDPRQVPLYPQRAAELMAGRRMLSAHRWVEPADLDEVVIGPETAREIRWIP
ncbi:MAG: hypothetical protein KGL92_00645 [Gammaproteobacteria bacterium]|nr:hypothetical protein [Gammaproteobacteria bacterium]